MASVSGRPRPGLGRGQLASRLGQLPSRVGRGDTPTPLLPGFLPTPIGGLLPIYLNMRMHNTVCVPSCRARRMARPTIGFSACLPRRAASAPPAARRRRFEQRGLRHASSARPGRRDRARDLFVVRAETRTPGSTFSRFPWMFERHLGTVLPLCGVSSVECYLVDLCGMCGCWSGAVRRDARGRGAQRAGARGPTGDTERAAESPRDESLSRH